MFAMSLLEAIEMLIISTLFEVMFCPSASWALFVFLPVITKNVNKQNIMRLCVAIDHV